MSEVVQVEVPKPVPSIPVPPTVEFREYVLYPGSRTEIRRVIQGMPPHAHLDVKLTQDAVGIRWQAPHATGTWPWGVIRGEMNVPFAKSGK